MRKIILTVMTAFIIFSCGNNKNNIIKKNIFKMPISYGEKDLGFLLNKSNNINLDLINVYYRNGFYYISDSVNDKILKMTENGDCLLTIYNPKTNPHYKPTITDMDLSNQSDDNYTYLKLYIEGSIYSPGKITVDVNKNIYFINRDPKYKKTNKDGNIDEDVILKYDNKGNLLYTLGKEGLESSPFSNILEIITDTRNNLIVYEQPEEEIIIYKYSPDGILLKKSFITNHDIPLTQTETNYLIDIIDVKLSHIENNVYITCQYIEKKIENFSIKSYEIKYEKLLLYSLENNKIIKMLLRTNPQYLDVSKIKNNDYTAKLYGNKDKILKPFDNLVGMDLNGNIYFSQSLLPTNDYYEIRHKISVYTDKGYLKKSYTIENPNNLEFISDFYLSTSGKIYYYYVLDGEVQSLLLLMNRLIYLTIMPLL